MKTFRNPLQYFLGLTLAVMLASPLAARNPPPEPRDESAPPAAPVAPAEPADEEKPAKKADRADHPDRELRELDGTASPRERSHRQRREYIYTDDAPVGHQTVPSDVRQGELISIFGSSTVDGHVTGEAISVFGDTTVNGRVDGEVLSVLGTTTINGYAGGEAFAVLGDVILGPDAEVRGDIVAIMGRVVRAPGAKVRGEIIQVGFGGLESPNWIHAYVEQCLKYARPLAIGENLGWVWAVAAGFLIFYMLLALVFPRGIERCAEVLEQKPGNTIIATIVTALFMPVLIVVLVMTGIGIVLIPFVVIGLFIAGLFGKAAVLAWFGRRFTPAFGSGPLAHPVAAVLLGGLVVCALYLIPFLGLLLQQLFTILGTGMVVYVLLLASRREKAVPAPAAAAVAAAPLAVPGSPTMAVPRAPISPAMPATAGMGGTVEGAPPVVSAVPPIPTVPPIMISAATLPRAGFWIRLAAAFLDFLLIGVATMMIHEMVRLRVDGPGFLFFALAVYSAALWKSRGTTIGGIICGLKVVRTDDRPIDWTIAIVRALSAFLSFAVAGLGFIWVAFDDEKQSWHDKVAGTTIVKVPKGVSLL
ncbi:MAG TPA: RDD family protein [Opitutaceae bacterium]|nr:RDD family protein [Opitutaceae bacterium]